MTTKSDGEGLNWRRRAACLDRYEIIDAAAEIGDAYARRKAEEMCNGCEVRIECFYDGLEAQDKWLTRAGMSARKFRVALRAHKQAQQANQRKRSA